MLNFLRSVLLACGIMGFAYGAGVIASFFDDLSEEDDEDDDS
jgi:hypothetical protein